MADILHMPLRPRPKGRRRERPIEGAPLAEVDAIDFGASEKPTYAELTAYIDRIAYHLLEAGRAVMDLSQACRD